MEDQAIPSLELVIEVRASKLYVLCHMRRQHFLETCSQSFLFLEIFTEHENIVFNQKLLFLLVLMCLSIDLVYKNILQCPMQLFGLFGHSLAWL